MDYLTTFIDREVVIDLCNNYLIYGTLRSVEGGFMNLENVDVHDQNEANSTKDVYSMEAKSIGIRPNRLKCSIPCSQMLALSALDDVIP